MPQDYKYPNSQSDEENGLGWGTAFRKSCITVMDFHTGCLRAERGTVMTATKMKGLGGGGGTHGQLWLQLGEFREAAELKTHG